MKDNEKLKNELLKVHFVETKKLRDRIAELEEENRLAWAVVEQFLKKYGNAVVHAEDMNKTEFKICVGENLSGEVVLRYGRTESN